MTRPCRYILKICRKSGIKEFAYNQQKQAVVHIHKLDEFSSVKKYADEVGSSFIWLEENGYIIRQQHGFSLTQKGLHPYEIIAENIGMFLLRSVLVPIVLSILTTLITLYIKSLL